MKKKEEKTLLDILKNEEYYKQQTQDEAFFGAFITFLIFGCIILFAHLLGAI